MRYSSAAWRATCACCGRRRTPATSAFAPTLLWDLSRPVTPDTDAATRADLLARGIAIAEAHA